MESSDVSLYIRPARASDSPSLSHICLVTGDAGKSAESFHSFPELLGLFYAVPYVHLPHAGGFVLVRRRSEQLHSTDGVSKETSVNADEDVVGYILFTHDTRKFEQALERDWLPPLRAKYAKPAEGNWKSVYGTQLTEADKRFISLLHTPDRATDASIAFSPAHFHINILPDAQRQGWGRRLVDAAVKYLHNEKGLAGVWVSMDPRNIEAARFYERLGFRTIEGAPDNCVGLRFV